MPALRPFFSYFGAKWRLSLQYPEPRHRRIVEPFAGSAGYSLRHPDHDIVLIEKNPQICDMWKFLIDATEDDILGLPLIDFDQTIDDLDLPCNGARVLVGFWLARGSVSPASAPNAWMKKHHESHPGSFWGERVRARIASQVLRIKHWTVIESNYTDVPNWIATWFVDPPYEQAGKSYVHGSDEIDYGELGQWCRKRRGQTIVCENQGAKWLPFRRFTETKGTRKPSVEVLWTT